MDASDHVRGIAVVVQEQGDSFTDDVYHKKTSLYSGLNFNWPGSVSGYLHTGFERFDRTSFDGLPSEPDGSAPPVPRSFFIGAADIVMSTQTYHAEGDLTWHATDLLDVNLKGNYQNVNTHGSLSFSSGLDESGNVGVSADRFRQPVVNYGIGLSGVYRLDATGLKNSFVTLAALYQSSTLRFDELTPPQTPTANLFDGQAALVQAFDSLLAQASVPFAYSTHNTQLTLSEQTWIQLLDPLTPMPSLNDINPSYTGYSVAKWHGNTLEVETLGVRADVQYLDFPHTAKMKILEKIHLTAPNLLQDDLTVIDPDVLTRPYTFTFGYKKEDPSYRVMEYVCDNNHVAVGQDGSFGMKVESQAPAPEPR